MNNNVISKSMAILRLFSDEKNEWGVRELAKHLSMPIATTHRIMLQLQEEGILFYDSLLEKYIIGTEWLRISNRVISNFDIKKIVFPYLKNLSEKHEETFCFILFNQYNNTIVWVDKYNGPSALQYVIPFGMAQPLPFGASGKSILAFLKEEDIKKICEKENFSAEKINKILEECKHIRQSGYSNTSGERIEGAKGFAAPIINSANHPIGSIILTTPENKKMKYSDTEIINDLLSSTQEISSILGK
ncbi:IclR family transcriptional regulator [Lysinibacillus capsici]